MADENHGPNGQGRSHALNRPKPSSAAITNMESAATFSRSKSPVQSRAADSSNKSTPLNSQPMIKTLSSSSALSTHGGNVPENNGSSPYGTRSRYRTGNARPNYAEDREMEMEIDWHSTKKSHVSGASAAASLAQAVESDRSVGVSTRRSSNATSGVPTGKVAPTNQSKDPIPGMSTFSLGADGNATAHPPPSKKRKAPGTNGNLSNASTGLGHATSNGHSRRTVATFSSISNKQTNMLSFETCQGYLKNGRLKADDGTSLALNGMLIASCGGSTDTIFR